MAEEKYKVQVYEIDYKCDVCGKGWYRPKGEVHPTYPLQFPHKCNFCGAEMVVRGHTYPYTVTEKVIEAEDERMSVLIKGMKMPNNCMACDIEEVDDYGNEYRCPLIYKGYTSKIRQDGKLPKCPLVELPERHGRLVDVDELSKKMYHDAFESDTDLQKWDNGCWIRYKMFENNIDDAPTVIEAED